MSVTSDLKSRCESAALLTEKWMLQYLLDEDILNRDHPDPVSFYKWPLTLYSRGNIQYAKNLLYWIMEKTLSVNGDLVSSRKGFHKDFHSYANLWLILAAINLEDSMIKDKLMGFLLNHHNSHTGGMATVPGLNGGTEDPLSTSFLGMAANDSKNPGLANLVLKYLISLTSLQPDVDKFWLRTTPEGKLIMDIPSHEDPKTYSVSIGKHDETYYFLGSMCFFLAGYIEKFGMNDNTSVLVRWLHEVLSKTGSEALGTIWAAKVGPGSIALYSVLSDKRFLEFAKPVINAVLDSQTANGYWLKEDKPWITVSAEQCYWLTFISNRL